MPRKSRAVGPRNKKKSKLFNIDSQHLADLASLGSQSLAEVANIVTQSLAPAENNKNVSTRGSDDLKASKYIVQTGRFGNPSEHADANENHPLDSNGVGEINPEGLAGDVEVSVAGTGIISGTPAAAGYLNPPPFMKTAPKIKSFRQISPALLSFVSS